MAIFFLVRHGQNDMVGKKLAGRLPGVHLNSQGQSQARRLAAELAELPIKAVYASPLERAQETAEPIARIHDLPVLTNEGLIEIDYGLWEGKSIKQLRRLKLWRNVQEAPDGFCFPDGETFNEAQSRIAQTLQTLNQGYAENDLIVCVSHCDVIRLAVAFFLQMPLNAFQRLHIHIASVTELHLVEGKVSFGPINASTGFAAYRD
jgi:probable phosphoglycerate mutase